MALALGFHELVFFFASYSHTFPRLLSPKLGKSGGREWCVCVCVCLSLFLGFFFLASSVDLIDGRVDGSGDCLVTRDIELNPKRLAFFFPLSLLSPALCTPEPHLGLNGLHADRWFYLHITLPKTFSL